MLGIGLGGFSRGVGTGIEIGEKINEGIEKRKQRKMFESATEQGRKDYDAAVTAGTEQPGDPTGVLRYAMPHTITPLLQAGKYDEAAAAGQWYKSEQAAQGTRLFTAGMLKGQNGDMEGAVNDFIGAAKLQGYGPGYEVGPIERIEGGGIRFTIKDPKTGKEAVQEFRNANEVAEWGARIWNPQSAFQQWQESQKAAVEDRRTVKTHGDKERAKLSAKTEDDVTRTNLGLPSSGSTRPTYVAAQNLAIRRLIASGRIGGMTNAGADPAAQEALIEAETQRILAEGGGSVGINPEDDDEDEEMIVDPKTGQLVSN